MLESEGAGGSPGGTAGKAPLFLRSFLRLTGNSKSWQAPFQPLPARFLAAAFAVSPPRANVAQPVLPHSSEEDSAAREPGKRPRCSPPHSLKVQTARSKRNTKILRSCQNADSGAAPPGVSVLFWAAQGLLPPGARSPRPRCADTERGLGGPPECAPHSLLLSCPEATASSAEKGGGCLRCPPECVGHDESWPKDGPCPWYQVHCSQE